MAWAGDCPPANASAGQPRSRATAHRQRCHAVARRDPPPGGQRHPTAAPAASVTPTRASATARGQLALALKQPPIPALDPARDDLLGIKLALGLGLRSAVAVAVAVGLGLGVVLGLAASSQFRAPATRGVPRRSAVPRAAHPHARRRAPRPRPRRSRPRPRSVPARSDQSRRSSRAWRCRAAWCHQARAPHGHQPGTVTRLQHVGRQPRQRVLMTTHKPRDRRVIRHPVRRDHPVGDVLTAVTLNPARGVLTRRVAHTSTTTPPRVPPVLATRCGR